MAEAAEEEEEEVEEEEEEEEDGGEEEEEVEEEDERHEGSKRVWMTWRATSGRPHHAQGMLALHQAVPAVEAPEDGHQPAVSGRGHGASHHLGVAAQVEIESKI